jgi:aminoglycoside phosphotransferase (APT) family kinase protein
MASQRLPDDPVPLSSRDSEFATRLVPFLRQALGISEPVEVRRFPGGRANLTYLVVTPEGELVVRRPPFGPIPPKAHDMEREYRVMSALSTKLRFVPRTVALCTDGTVSDRAFFVMERAHGFVLREEWPAFLPDDTALRSQMAEGFLAAIIELHAVQPADVGLQSLGRPEGFMQRQVRDWAERSRNSAMGDQEAADRVFAWLATERVPGQLPAIIHNDLKFDNVMLDWDEPARVRAVFDWDMATLGDPLADLGLLLSYWGQSDDDPERFGGRLPITALKGFPSRACLVEEYSRRTGRDLSAARFYEVFGLVKLAVLCQQLLQRYRQGDSDDVRVEIYKTQVPAIWAEAGRLARV